MTKISTVYKKQYIKLCNSKRSRKKIGVYKHCWEDKKWGHLGPALKTTIFLETTTIQDKQIRLK